jgi:hypothetical protein
MQATKTKKSTNNDVVIVKKMKDYSKEPAIIKKAEAADAFIKKNGLPQFLKKAK